MSEDKLFLVIEASILDACGHQSYITPEAGEVEPHRVDGPYGHLSVQQAVMGPR